MCRCELACGLLCATGPCGREQQRATPRISGSKLTSRCTLPCAGLSELFGVSTAAAVVVASSTKLFIAPAIIMSVSAAAVAAAAVASTVRARHTRLALVLFGSPPPSFESA